VLARTLGIPSRVAIGYIPNERQGDLFQVRGKDAHAWPEVFIDGKWVSYEPTPGRGNAAQDGTPEQPTTTVPPTTLPQQPTVPTTLATAAPAQAPADSDGNGLPIGALLRILLLGAGFAGLLCVPTLVRRYRSTRGLADDASSISRPLQLAWVGLEDDAAWLGYHRSPAVSVPTWARGLPNSFEWATAVRTVADRMELLRYQPGAAETEAALLSDIQAARRMTTTATPKWVRGKRFLSFRLRPRPTDPTS
jgi:hypothetical protein